MKSISCRYRDDRPLLALMPRVLLDVIRREDFAGRPGFRQHIDDAVRPGKSRAHYVLEELRRNIDAAIGNTVVERRRSGQALQAALLGLVGNTGCMETAPS